MCGICGVVNIEHEDPVKYDVVDRMCKVITHRGPDDQGIFVEDNIGIGMRRLSIIDLQTGKQPISNEDGSVWITYNGEIFNHDQLRTQNEA